MVDWKTKSYLGVQLQLSSELGEQKDLDRSGSFILPYSGYAVLVGHGTLSWKGLDDREIRTSITDDKGRNKPRLDRREAEVNSLDGMSRMQKIK